MSPHQYCRDKAAGSSFYYSFWLLSAERRRAMMALYAFCREVDDVVDNCRETSLAAMKLGWWRREISALQDGTPQHPVSRALLAARQHYRLTPGLLQVLIDGMEMDLSHTRYPDYEALQLYCYRVAAVVGLLSAEIFGYKWRETLDYAHDLGIAFQLTNIIRDVGEDARRGRIYLPQDELECFGVDEADLLAGRYTQNFQALMTYQYGRANAYYLRALEKLPKQDRRAQRPGLAMAAIYRQLLEAMRADGYAVLHQRYSLPPMRKAWLVLKTWLNP